MGPHRDIAIRVAWGVRTAALLGLAGLGVYVVVADRADADAQHVLVAQAIVAPVVVALLRLCAALVARYGAGLRADAGGGGPPAARGGPRRPAH
jgi:uncharacterized membrane protein (Fun14 family)